MASAVRKASERRRVQVIQRVDEREAAGNIAAVVEDLPPEKLLEEDPQPGEVLAVEELTELGAKELKLSNGMVVVFRHSDMQEDQVLLSVRARLFCTPPVTAQHIASFSYCGAASLRLKSCMQRASIPRVFES